MEYHHSDPESMGSIFAKLFLRATNRRMGFEKQVRKGDFSGNDVPLPPGFIQRQFSVGTRMVKGRNVFTISPLIKESEKVILYLHGGGYVQNCMKQHWQLFRQVILATGCRMVVPDYLLAGFHALESRHRCHRKSGPPARPQRAAQSLKKICRRYQSQSLSIKSHKRIA